MEKYFSRAPLRLEKLFLEDCDGEAGGIVTFVGTPRASSDGRKVLALSYEAYETMAAKMLDDIVFEAQVRWPLTSVLLKHRLGKVLVGQPSIVVQVRAPHRYEAFAACQFLIDRLKKEVPIWKKEIYQDGEHVWVHCDHGPGQRQHMPQAKGEIPLDDLL